MMKKILSLILAACLLISLVPSAFAAEKNMTTYDNTRNYAFTYDAYGKTGGTTATQDYWNTETVKSVSDQWNLVSRAGTNWMQLRDNANGGNYQWNAYQYNVNGGTVVAIRFNVDEAGTYIPKLSYNAMTDGYIHNIYILPDDGSIEWSNAITTNKLAMDALLKDKTPVATIDMWGAAKETKIAELDSYTVATPGNYLLILLSNGYNEKMIPYQPDNRLFVRAELNSFELVRDTSAQAVANGVLDYRLRISSLNGDKMYTSSTAKTADNKTYSWATFPGFRDTSSTTINGVKVGSFYNPSLMSWDAEVYYNNKGEKVEEPIKVMNLEKTDPWKVEYLDVYNSYPILFGTSDTFFFNVRANTDGGTTFQDSFYNAFILFRVKVPYAGKYELSVNKSTSAGPSGHVPALYFFPVDEANPVTSVATARTRITDQEKLGYVNFSNKEIDGCIEKVVVNAPNGGDYYIALKLDRTSSEKNGEILVSGAAYYQNTYFHGFTLTPIAGDDVRLGLALSASKNALTAGESVSLTATETMRDAGARVAAVTYKSSSPSVATVDASGKLTAIAGGKTLITAETTDGATDSLWITVSDKAASKKISYAITTSVNPSAIDVKSGDRNEKITVTAEDIDGYKFRHWVRGSADNGSWVSSDKSFSFNLMTNTYLTAVYTEDKDEKLVEFFNENGEFYAEAIANAEGKVALPENPTRTGFKFAKWLLSEETEFTADTVVTADITRAVARYEESGDEFAVTLPDASAENLSYGDAVTLKAEASNGKAYYAYWYRDGKQVAYGTEYKYLVWDDTVITKSTAGVQVPTVVLDKVKKSGNAYMIEYDAMGKEIVEVGIIFGNGNHTVESCDSKATSQNTADHGQFTAKPGKTGGTVARGYLIYNDKGTYRVVYSD